jgi:hypothetical protein
LTSKKKVSTTNGSITLLTDCATDTKPLREWESLKI